MAGIILRSSAALAVLFLTAAVQAEEPHLTAASDATWLNTPVAAQAGVALADFTIDVHADAVDGLVALSGRPGTKFTDYSVILRFSDRGLVEVRNGIRYAADAVVPYSGGQRYTARLLIDVKSRWYSVWVTPPGGTEITLATNYVFRSERGVHSLDNLGVWAEDRAGGPAALDACLTRFVSCSVSERDWLNTPFEAPQSGVFTATFEAAPLTSPLEAAVGLSSTEGRSPPDFAALLRFNPSGMLEARDGATCRADAPIAVQLHRLYQFRMQVDLPHQRYSAWVRPAGGEDLQLASNYALDHPPSDAGPLTHIGLQSDAGALALGPVTIAATQPSTRQVP